MVSVTDYLMSLACRQCTMISSSFFVPIAGKSILVEQGLLALHVLSWSKFSYCFAAKALNSQAITLGSICKISYST